MQMQQSNWLSYSYTISRQYMSTCELVMCEDILYSKLLHNSEIIGNCSVGYTLVRILLKQLDYLLSIFHEVIVDS